MGGKVTKVRQLKFLMRCAYLFAKHSVCNCQKIEVWWKVVRYCHKKGFLYAGFDADELDLCVIAYRIPEINEDTISDEIPSEEKGNILYVHAAVSESEDDWKLFRLFNWYCNKHKDIKQICYHEDNDDNRLNILTLRRDRNGKVKSPINS